MPFFTKDLKKIKGLSTINARAESITKAPAWRKPFRKRRCVVPANSFCEWPKERKPPKQPYAFELANGSPLAFTGPWYAWKDGQEHWLQSFAIVTMEANELMSRIHPRMPGDPVQRSSSLSQTLARFAVPRPAEVSLLTALTEEGCFCRLRLLHQGEC